MINSKSEKYNGWVGYGFGVVNKDFSNGCMGEGRNKKNDHRPPVLLPPHHPSLFDR